MYRMIIADDEHLVAKSLKASINWRKYGVEIIGEASNGIEAYELILRLKPDIVFVDIRMPGMNGLELIKKVNEEECNTVFVVISGYAEFAYAQKAMSYGALGFCLKPFEESDLLNVLKKAVTVIEKNTANIETGFMALIDDYSPEGLRKKRELLKSLGYDWNAEKGIVVFISIGKEKLKLESGARHIVFTAGKERYGYLLSSEESGSIIASLAGRELPEGITSIGVSNAHPSPDALETAIAEAGMAAQQYFMTGEQDIYRYAGPDTAELDSLFQRLEEAVLKKDIPLVKRLLEEFGEAFSQGMYDVGHAFKVYNRIIYSFYTPGAERYDFILNDEMLMHSFKSVHEMLDFLRGVIMEYGGINRDYAHADPKNVTFKNILNYINEHFLENICIRDISRMFNVNANYVSHLFKKEKGIAFTEYIADLRINYACTLLKTTGLAVSEIAEKTGFNDYFYFARVFKKATGKTPSTFRNEYCTEK